MTVLAIDPGPERSAFVVFSQCGVGLYGIEPNRELRMHLDTLAFGDTVVVIEQIASYGMPVGADVFETVRWAGRFEERISARCVARYLPRREVKLHLCGQVRAKDSNIRQALLDRFGGKDKAIGKKSSQGPLYGVKADCWQALALAVTWYDLHGTPTGES